MMINYNLNEPPFLATFLLDGADLDCACLIFELEFSFAWKQ